MALRPDMIGILAGVVKNVRGDVDEAATEALRRRFAPAVAAVNSVNDTELRQCLRTALMRQYTAMTKRGLQ